MVKRRRPEGEAYVAISGGTSHTCALREDGTPVCWGSDSFGQASPLEGEVLTLVSSGWNHTCGLRNDWTAVCWGNNEDGQASPPEGERFTSIASGYYVTCGLREDGKAMCWGRMLDSWGHGWEEAPEERFVQIDVAHVIVCGIKDDGYHECWGEYGDVVVEPSSEPSWGHQFSAFSLGGQHSCELWANGTAVCFGSLEGKSPLQERFAAISSGYDHTCGITLRDGYLICWGEDEHGQSSPAGGQRFTGYPDDPSRVHFGPERSLRFHQQRCFFHLRPYAIRDCLMLGGRRVGPVIAP